MPTPPTRPAHPPDPFQPVAGLLAFAFPGAGHFFLGHRTRALGIVVGVLGLFITGLLVGGISCVDRRENFIWFLGQALNGPITFAVDYVHDKHFKVIDRPSGTIRSAHPFEFRHPRTAQPIPIAIAGDGSTSANVDGKVITPAYPPYVKGVGRMSELGTLFITIAGFMNLICIIDAAFTHRRETRTPNTVVGKL